MDKNAAASPDTFSLTGKKNLFRQLVPSMGASVRLRFLGLGGGLRFTFLFPTSTKHLLFTKLNKLLTFTQFKYFT